MLGLGYRSPVGQLAAKYRNRYLSGGKDVFDLQLSADASESDVVEELSDLFTSRCREVSDTKGRLPGPSEASVLSTAELLAFLVQPFHDQASILRKE